MALPLKLPQDQLQTRWKAEIDPVLANPLNSVTILENVTLKVGVNTINHLLQRKPQGWFFTDIQAPATVFRSSPYNSLTLILTSSAQTTVNIGVF